MVLQRDEYLDFYKRIFVMQTISKAQDAVANKGTSKKQLEKQ